jgi:hypothetical protein
MPLSVSYDVAQYRSGLLDTHLAHTYRLPDVKDVRVSVGALSTCSRRIPLTKANGVPLPRRDLILVLAATGIVVSLVVQGFTLEPLVQRAGIARPAAARHEQTVARLEATRLSEQR